MLGEQINYIFLLFHNCDQETEIQSFREDSKYRIYIKLPRDISDFFFHEEHKLLPMTVTFLQQVYAGKDYLLIQTDDLFKFLRDPHQQ